MASTSPTDHLSPSPSPPPEATAHIHSLIPHPTPPVTESDGWDVPPQTKEHLFYLADKKTGFQWLTLSMKSRATRDDEMPTFYQGAVIEGTVKMILEKDRYMDNVTIELWGRMTIYTLTATMPTNFLLISRKLYAATDDTSTPALHRGRLHKGAHEWPFAFHLPKGVEIMYSRVLGRDGEKKAYRLPPTFADMQGGVVVEYQLAVRANRTGLRARSKLVAPFKYVPLARPGPPSALRQLAYEKNTALMGPDADREGWKTLDPVKIEGTLHKTTPVWVVCKLSIAKPLTYTRGTPIPLHITVESNNEEFLDLLTPDCIRVSLIQRLHFGDDAAFWPRFSSRLPPRDVTKTVQQGIAVWWRGAEPQARSRKSFFGESTRTFSGELSLKEDLVPCCQILHYSHEYEVVLHPLAVSNFSTSARERDVLFSEPVNVVTEFAQAPRPRVYALVGDDIMS